MSNWKQTRKASIVVSLVQETGTWGGTTSDPHPPVGNEQGSTRLARVELHFSGFDIPASGHLVGAHLTLQESGTSEHANYKGSHSRATVRRINSTPDKHSPSSVSGDTITFSFNGSETHSVASLVEEMLPTRIKRRDGTTAGGNVDVKYWFQVRSDDESNDQHSFIMSAVAYLTIEIKTAVTPDAPGIIEVIGAQEGTSNPTIVGSTDGRTLAVRFAYHGAAGDRPAKAELALYGIGATDATPGAAVKTTGSIVPTPGGSTGVYTIKLTGIAQGLAGRFRIRTTSQKGEQGDWSSLDDTDVYVQMATIPGPPLDVVFQPFASSPHILGTLNSPDPADYITGAEAEATYVPQGTLAVATGMDDIGGTTRRSDQDTGIAVAPGQVVSYRLRHRNKDQVVGQWSAPATQTVREAQAVTFSPAPGRLTSVTPTITLTFPLADGARLRLLDPLDDTKVIWDSGATVLVNQTSHGFAVPAGKLAYGQRFNAVGSYVPDGGGVTYTTESEPVGYSVANLPTTRLSVPDAVGGKVGTTAPLWLRTVTDPDGSTAALILQGFYAAATPQGTGAFVHQFVGGSAGPVAIPGLTVAYETGVDSIARTANDIDPLASTTLNGALSVGATGLTLTSGTDFVTGQDLVIASAVSGETEVRRATVAGTAVTWPGQPALEHAHGNGQAVTARVFGPLSNWLTITALQPPDVDLISPASGATLVDPTQQMDWSVTGHGGRTQASAVLTIIELAGGSVVASIPVGTPTQVDIPAYLLDDATGYGWYVTVTDTEGMVGVSTVIGFTTAFADPMPITVLLVDTDPDSGTTILTWDTGSEPYPFNYEVTWLDDEGAPVRIDGGPESLLDDGVPFTGGTLTHIGARLGVNVYYVAVSNGWRSSDPVSTSVTLDQPANNLGSWHLKTDGVFVQLRSLGQPIVTPAMVERMQAPGGQPREIAWGLAARTVSMTVDIRPTVDGPLSTTLRTLMADARRGRAATPVWLAPPAGWLWDPIWVTLQGFTDSPGTGGRTQISIDMAELGDPMYAALPPPPDTTPEGEPNAIVDSDVDDFGGFTLP